MPGSAPAHPQGRYQLYLGKPSAVNGATGARKKEGPTPKPTWVAVPRRHVENHLELKMYSVGYIGRIMKGRNTCQWLVIGSTKLCGTRCMKTICGVHLATLRKGAGQEHGMYKLWRGRKKQI